MSQEGFKALGVSGGGGGILSGTFEKAFTRVVSVDTGPGRLDSAGRDEGE